MWIVAWEQKAQSEKIWTRLFSLSLSENVARDLFKSLLPGPAGSFGPISYRNVSFSKVIEYYPEA